MKLEIDYVIETSLVAIFSTDLLSESIYLKGGQALRVKEQLRNRFSADMDFSFPDKISDEDVFFEMMQTALEQEFYANGLSLFDFKAVRKPRFKAAGTPDFWSGWGVEFKLIEKSKRNDPPEKRSREALIPVGANSPTITIDISEHEYCGSVERIQIKGTQVNVYSRTLLILEKIRAICQQHPEYPYKSNDQRARDYYDIERLWSKVLKDGNTDAFLRDCASHFKAVFDAKGVTYDLLEKIFSPNFVELQRSGWSAVEVTVRGRLQPFEYYNETLKSIISEIKIRMIDSHNREG